MIEEWRPVDWAPDYEVSSLGNVRSWKPYPWNAPAPTEPRPLRATRNQETGYHSVQLYYGTGTSRRAVHRLVAEAFVPNPYGLPEVAHRNGDQTDNRACNLRWSTKADNEADKLEHGTLRFGSKNPLSRLTDQDVRKIRALYAIGDVRQTDLATRFGVSQKTISNAVRNVTYKEAVHDSPTSRI